MLFKPQPYCWLKLSGFWTVLNCEISSFFFLSLPLPIFVQASLFSCQYTSDQCNANGYLGNTQNLTAHHILIRSYHVEMQGIHRFKWAEEWCIENPYALHDAKYCCMESVFALNRWSE